MLSTGGGWGCIQVRGSSDSAFRLWPCIAPNMVILGLCWLIRLGSAGGLKGIFTVSSLCLPNCFHIRQRNLPQGCCTIQTLSKLVVVNKSFLVWAICLNVDTLTLLVIWHNVDVGSDLPKQQCPATGLAAGRTVRTPLATR